RECAWDLAVYRSHGRRLWFGDEPLGGRAPGPPVVHTRGPGLFEGSSCSIRRLGAGLGRLQRRGWPGGPGTPAPAGLKLLPTGASRGDRTLRPPRLRGEVDPLRPEPLRV